jgi:hypothetical protein
MSGNCTNDRVREKQETPARECGGLLLQKSEGEWCAAVKKQFSEI